MKQQHLILGIGELLWDVLPEGKRLGGAPANFAVMMGRLGDRSVILSRIGRDDLGRQAIDQLDPMPTETRFIEIDPGHNTGHVTVSLSNGEPKYTIHQPAAWDFLELSSDWVQLAKKADAICFGSLAQRNLASQKAIQALAAEASAACIRVFDVNLREPYYSSEVVEESLELATVVKMNDAEAPLVLDLLNLGNEIEAQSPAGPSNASSRLRGIAEVLLREFPALQLVAITRGSHGSLLVCRDGWHDHPGFPVKLGDCVGAGDAFTAAMTHYLLRGADLATLNEAGNRWGGWIASQSGAMPSLPDSVRAAIAQAIEKSAN